MYMTHKDLVWQLSNKIKELAELQNKIILDNVNNLDSEASEEEKDLVNRELGGI